MVVVSILKYVAECDICGARFEDLYDDDLEAHEDVLTAGWVWLGDTLMCVDCDEDSPDEYTGP